MHGIKMFACLLLGCCARLFGGLSAYWWAVLHVYLWGYVHTARLFARLLEERGYVHTAGYLVCLFIWGLCAYYWVFMHIY